MSSPVAMVTGAARGIGAAIAARLSRDGLAVALLDVHADGVSAGAEAIVAAGREAIGLTVDVSDEDAVVAGVARVAERLGPPTVLVNNAGIIRDNLLFKMTTNDWDAVMAVHLRGAFLLSRACQSHMVTAGFGRIVNLSSSSAQGNRGQANYSAAKAGLQGFTKTLAIELGKFGVTANAIAPGFIATDMLEETARRVGLPYEDFQQTLLPDIPVNRIGTPEDVAALASFFASAESGFVSGQVVYVAGGPLD